MTWLQWIFAALLGLNFIAILFCFYAQNNWRKRVVVLEGEVRVLERATRDALQWAHEFLTGHQNYLAEHAMFLTRLGVPNVQRIPTMQALQDQFEASKRVVPTPV